MSVSRLWKVRWSGLRLLALLVAVMGGWGVLSGLFEFPYSRVLSAELAQNAAFFGNDQRLEPAAALEGLVQNFPGNYLAVAGFSLFLLVLGVHFSGLITKLYRQAPVPSLLAGLFLGGSVLSGVFFALTVLKVNEFAFQATILSSAEREWLRDGITFWNQLHLVFIYGWFLTVGLGWVFAGWASFGRGRAMRTAAATAILGGLVVVLSVVARFWLPSYGAEAPEFMLVLGGQAHDVGMALGLLGSGLLGWLLEGEPALQPDSLRLSPTPGGCPRKPKPIETEHT